MLREILERLSEGGTWTVSRLAQELGTTPQLVEAAMEDLSRRGYLKPVGAACSGACASCSVASGCVKGLGERVWAVRSGQGAKGLRSRFR